MKFRAKLQSMAANEILSMITPQTLERIRKSDPKPLFKAFVIGQEGEASANLVGVGKIVKTWFKDAIGKLSRRMYSGMPLFHGHAETNSQDGRESIGEVVGTSTLDIGGKFSAFVATYIYPEYKNLPLDIASIEADITTDGFNSEIHAINVEDVTAIALGNSAIENPGFPGATLLGAVQAFVNKNTIQASPEGGDKMSITVNEVRSLIKAEGYVPSDFFGMGELTKDPMVAEYIEKAEERFEKSLISRKKRINEGFDETKEKLEENHKKVLEEKDLKIKKLILESSKTKAKDLFTSKAKERKLSDAQIKFIEMKREKDFNPEDPDKLDSEVNRFIDTGLEDFKATAEIFGKTKEAEADDDLSNPNTEPSGGVDASIIPD